MADEVYKKKLTLATVMPSEITRPDGTRGLVKFPVEITSPEELERFSLADQLGGAKAHPALAVQLFNALARHVGLLVPAPKGKKERRKHKKEEGEE